MIGNVLVGQSGGPTAVINSSLAGVYKTAKDQGAKKVYGMLYGVQGLLDKKYVDLSEHFKNDLEIELLKRTPSSYLGSCRYKLPDYEKDPAIYEKLFGILNRLNIKYFFYIGGNDSMDTINKLSKYAKARNSNIRFIGVPKTIDNDLEATDHTPGYGSAAKFIASTTKEIIRDGLVYDQKNVTVIEIMGRNVGWLTGAAALSKGPDCEGPDFIYLPETAFEFNGFLTRIEELQKHKKALVIAVSEGIRLADGRYVCELTRDNKTSDQFGHRQLAGSGKYLADFVAKELGSKSRGIELSTLQRCASHIASFVDITEAYQVGAQAVYAALEGKTGEMIILTRISDQPYQCVMGTYDIDNIANKEKKVPLNWLNVAGTNVTEDFINYVNPLIQEELSPIMINGLPSHIRFDRTVIA